MAHKGMDTIIKKETNIPATDSLDMYDKTKQLKRIADALEEANDRVNRKAMRKRHCGF